VATDMRFSYCMVPVYPLDQLVDFVKTADQQGFYAAYSVDETWWKDPFTVFAAAAPHTERIRFGPNVTHVFLREPTQICQVMATLDELTKGRTEIVVSTGNFGLMHQHGVDWANRKPMSRLIEAIHVMRTFLAEGAITFQGDHFTYNGLYTFAKPVQEHIPIKMGAMKGPRSFRVAGELTEGVHQALAYSREAYDYMAKHTQEGATKAGKDIAGLDMGAWCVTVVSEDSEAAKRAARLLVTFYVSAMPHEQLQRHGIDPSEVAPVVEALDNGDVPGALEAFKPEYAEKLSLAGTPEEIVEKIKSDMQPAGVNHMILAIVDAAMVKMFTGEDVPNVLDTKGQLKMVAEQIMPAFSHALA
jgi:5,10-methylenetetrahydromethanopterin reductase